MNQENYQVPEKSSSLPNASLPQVPQVNKPRRPLRNLKLVFLMTAVVVIGVVIFFLAKKFRPENPPPSTVLPTLKPTASPAEEVPETTVSSAISKTHNIFGFNVLAKLLLEDKEKNIFISPSSIALALSMVYNGADAETKEAMAETLQVQGIDLEKLNGSNLALMKILENPDPRVQLAIANSIWTREGVNFNPEFLQTNEKYYQAEVKSLDFSDQKSVEVINLWVKENTKGKILEIVKPPITSEMVMYLINAIYFKGNWTVEFEKKLTEDRDFTLGDGTVRKKPMMQQEGNFLYLENDLFQAINLPYGENKRLGMYVFLPKASLADFANLLETGNWQEWLEEFKETEGTIVLPKFKIEYEKKLNETLKSLGMEIAFGARANFSKIGENLFISEVIHKTYVDVNEEGTEAAAVTEVGVGLKAIDDQKKTFYMKVDKPFYFAIVDSQSSEILFMGLISEPE